MGAEVVAAVDPAQAAAAERAQYAEISHGDLIDVYTDTGDASVGRELSIRLFEHAGLAIDPTQAPLVGRDGQQIQGNSGPLTLADYVNYALDHHPDGALDGILGFLEMEPGTTDHATVRDVMLERLAIGKA